MSMQGAGFGRSLAGTFQPFPSCYQRALGAWLAQGCIRFCSHGLGLSLRLYPSTAFPSPFTFCRSLVCHP